MNSTHDIEAAGSLAVPLQRNDFRRLLGIFTLLLVGFTWRLWLPLTAFPRIPLVSALSAEPIVAWVFTGGIVAGAVLLLLPRASLADWGGGLLAGSFGLSFLFNQHTLQPWAWQFSIFGLLLACCSRARFLILARWLVISIYLHSGLSKLDTTFVHTHGQQLLGGLFSVFGVELNSLPGKLSLWLAVSLPLTELLLALLLLIPKTRTVGMWLGIVLHGLLLVTLSPLGLNHHAGVLLWNLFFIAQLWVLFRQPKFFPNNADKERRSWSSTVAVSVTWLVMLLPFLEPWGGWDRWPSWAVYAARPPRVDVYFTHEVAQQLPAELQPYLSQVSQESHGKLWQEFQLNRWSLGELNVPALPEPRFQLGVVLWLCEREHIQDEVGINFSGAAERWSGKRNTRWLAGRQEIARELENFRLNGFP